MLLNLFCLLVHDVMEPFVKGSDVMNLCYWWVYVYHPAWCYWQWMWLVGLWLPPFVMLVGLGLPPCQMVWHYLRCNSGDFASTSSQMCGNWNFPMFLFRDGSFTLMNMASLMFLAMLLSSLPTTVKLSRDTSWPVVLWWSMMGDGDLMCSLYLSPKVLPDSPMYSSPQSTLPQLYL